MFALKAQVEIIPGATNHRPLLEMVTVITPSQQTSHKKKPNFFL